ncbi:ABC transporter substrate-binding protein [uncultured Friedmanniella sp.]|uniref:ABC transporter substrate-binding protein n=1 Tax=uncultured Friedmanniella sp. TaxID=335381 RepID=UPI0035CC6792
MNPISRRTLLGASLSAPVLAGLAACGASGGSSGSSSSTATVRWVSSSEPTSWDLVVQGSGFQYNQLALVYTSLTTINEQGEAQPGLAKSWKYNAKGDAITFSLREGLTFTDGSPVNSSAVRAYIARAQKQANSAIAGDLTSIKEVVAESDTEVTFRLAQVDYQIPLLLGQRIAAITSEEAGRTPDGLTTKPVGHGPFKALEIVPGAHAYFEKNPDYYDAANIFIDRFELSWGIDAASVVSSVQTGVYDFADVVASQVQAAKGAGLDVIEHPVNSASNLSINANLAPFTDPRVVEAVRHAVNRDELLAKVNFGTGWKTSQPFPPGHIAYDPESADPWPYDPEKARKILADAGYTENDARLEIPFVVPTDAASNEILQAQLAAVGIKAAIKVDTNWQTPFFAKDLVLSTYGTTGRESPVQTLTAHFGPQGPLNLSGPFTSKEFQRRVAIARQTPLEDPDYAKNLQAATRAGVRDTATVFTIGAPTLFAKTKRLTAIPPVPGQVHWTGVKIQAD